MILKSVNLRFKAGSSNKVYQVQLEEKDNGYVVNFQFGKFGSALSAGSKMAAPVSLKEAEKIYDKLVAEKTAKGYTESESGTPYLGSELVGKMSGMIPQLPNPITEERALQLLEDDDFFMQEKEDGRHMMAEVSKESVVFSNRKGIIISAADNIAKDLQKLPGLPNKVDGENMGDTYILFDLLQSNWDFGGAKWGFNGTSDLTLIGAWDRFMRLDNLIYSENLKSVSIAKTAYSTEQKKKLFYEIKAARGEGVVFKKKDAVYIPGRPASGGDCLKFKFKASATCRVLNINGSKRSVSILVRNDNPDFEGPKEIQVGNVTILPNFEIPTPGELIEVEYLYSYPGGALYQPIYKGPRPDKDTADLYSSLKFKQGTLEEDIA